MFIKMYIYSVARYYPAKLLDDVLASYNVRNPKKSIPLQNGTDPVTVNFELWLVQILDFDMKSQIMQVILWESVVSSDHFGFYSVKN